MDQQPESGQTTYSYAFNSTGLQVTRIRPMANQTNPSVTTATTSQFDVLDRPLSVGYTDGTPGKGFIYDIGSLWGVALQHPKGRLVQQGSSAGGATIYSYDATGRVASMYQCTPSNCGTGAFQTTYTYDWLNLRTSSDGFGVTDTYTYSPANEVKTITSSLSDSTHPPNLVSNVQNGPFGPLTWQLGNGLTAVRQYDGMGRTRGGWACQGSSQPTCSGGSQIYGFANSWQGAYLTGACDTALNQCNSYGYDEFGRLASQTTTSGQTANYTWVYDRWGSRWQQNALSGGPSPQLSFNTSTNQIAMMGYAYDAAGNLTSDGIHNYAYDADGNVTLVDGGTTARNTYDAANQRVRIDTSGDANEFIFNSSGQRVSSWNPAGWQVQGQTYWGGTPVEFYQGGYAHFQHQDWMGTERARTSYAGSSEGTYTSLPFGDAYSASGTDNDAYHFATLDHDYGSNTDHAQFRQYSSMTGRFMSPDPSGLAYADPTNPQSLNLYSYALNNPLTLVDSTGLTPCDYGPSDYGGEDYGDTDSDDECRLSGGKPVDDYETVTVNATNSGSDSFSLYMVEAGSSTLIQSGPLDAPNSPTESGGWVCHGYVDPISAALIGGTKFKAGAAIEVADFSLNLASITKQVGQSGLGAEMSVGFKGIFSIQRTNDNYPGLNLGSGSHNSVTILGFNHDFASRPSDWTFQPSKEFRVGP
jgi:RHS repeat-associated protein